MVRSCMFCLHLEVQLGAPVWGCISNGVTMLVDRTDVDLKNIFFLLFELTNSLLYYIIIAITIVKNKLIVLAI